MNARRLRSLQGRFVTIQPRSHTAGGRECVGQSDSKAASKSRCWPDSGVRESRSWVEHGWWCSGSHGSGVVVPLNSAATGDNHSECSIREPRYSWRDAVVWGVNLPSPISKSTEISGCNVSCESRAQPVEISVLLTCQLSTPRESSNPHLCIFPTSPFRKSWAE